MPESVPHIESKKVFLYDSSGKPIKEKQPKPLTASWCRRVYYKGQARVGAYDKDGISTSSPIKEEVVRAQIPYVVTLLVYHSKLQIEPTMREYFVYAPLEVQKAAELALRLWQRWERPPRPEFQFGDMEDIFPKIDDGVVAEPLQDSDYDSHWKDVQKRPHRAAGDPDDPFAFTCLDQDVRVFKVSDFQEGLRVKIQ